ncbi:hypothetical protein DU508_17565 [Pedobacter chinensis]|uniref:Uncharacterized protein n=1 Tax=Pedobacter chinensis TaxID=2282421 RepID=A0A369PRW5_9SPHI|nr:hypothetical protein DU508_17565 [Pedobacter chinensis]
MLPSRNYIIPLTSEECFFSKSNPVEVWKNYTTDPTKGLFTTADPGKLGIGLTSLRPEKKWYSMYLRY